MNRVINFHRQTNPEWFENVVLLLKRKYNIISANDIVAFYEGHKKLYNACLLTVDDGDETSYTIIYPILKKHHVPAIFFISPEKMMRDGKHRNFWFQEARHCPHSEMLMNKVHLGNYSIEEIWRIIDRYKENHHVAQLSDQNMTLEQVLEIDKDGLVTIGAHTLDHPFLARESDEISRHEVVESIRQLEHYLGHPILTFAYPNGRWQHDFGIREMNYLNQTNIRVAFSTQSKDFVLQDNPLAIPRFGLSCGNLLFVRIKLLLGKRYKSIRKLISRLKLR